MVVDRGQQIVHSKVVTSDFCSNLKQSFSLVKPADLLVDLGFKLTDSAIVIWPTSSVP
jgi:hypothetical protein